MTDLEMDEVEPFFDAAEAGTLGSVLLYTCQVCGDEEYANDEQEPGKILDAGVCPKCGGPRELGLRDFATELNEFLGRYIETVRDLDWLVERVPGLAPEIERMRAEVEQSMENVRRVVGE